MGITRSLLTYPWWSHTQSEGMWGYIWGKTIAIRSWGFSLRAFSTHQSGTQRNWYNLGIGGRMLGVVE